MNSILAAFQFLTILPFRIKKIAPHTLAWAIVYFPVVGLFLGLALAGVNSLLASCGLNPLVLNIILVVLLIILTGGLHLDGLSDTSDALFSGKDRTGMLAIMRDPHVGVMGVLALVSVLLLKIAFISSISMPLKGRGLILMCVLARWSMVLLIFSFPYVRAEGKAKAFKDGINEKIFAIATLFAAVISFIILKWLGIVLLGIIAVFTYISGSFINRKIGGVTGDTIGAVNELAEVAVLGVVIICGKIFA